MAHEAWYDIIHTTMKDGPGYFIWWFDMDYINQLCWYNSQKITTYTMAKIILFFKVYKHIYIYIYIYIYTHTHTHTQTHTHTHHEGIFSILTYHLAKQKEE